MNAVPNAARAERIRPGGLDLDPFARVAVRLGRTRRLPIRSH